MDISIKELSHLYMEGTPMESLALKNVTLEIPNGEYLAVIGHTGSGKSTFIQHLNGLLKPSSGSVKVGDFELTAEKKKKENLRPLRKKVGIVFQYPEHQLFEETVEKDICFGPMNFGVNKETAKRKAKEMIQLVGLPDDVLHRSPFELSGGQMRRVAIAGVLAMEPEVLILDEPTAGLDPRGHKEIMDLFYKLHTRKELTTILVTHNMEDAAEYANRIVVFNKGEIFLEGTPSEIFKKQDKIAQAGLDVPETVQFIKKVQERFERRISLEEYTTDSVVNAVERLLKGELVYDE